MHELLHVISSRQHNYFNEDGIAYTKTGTKIDYFDKSLNECNMDSTPSSDGLNEGITEFLTSKITNVYTGNYPAYLAVASMLMACNDKLLTAYFSEDTKELEAFYDDLEEKQSVITRDNLCNLSSKELSDDELIKLIVGALKYNGAYNNTINIVEVSNYLDKFYMLDSGSWMNLILESVDKFEKIDSDTPISR